MFKDFDISFVDKNDEPLPIIILAGVNGSGKTSLLESLYNLDLLKNSYVEVHQTTKSDIVEVFKKDGIKYFNAGINEIAKVKKEFVKYWYNLVKFHNKRNDEITEELQKFIKEIFGKLTISVTYSHIDEDDNIFFKNDKDEKFKISELSTGEQTLFAKILYLFFQDYKDKVILIDEPELSLHPSWQNSILKIYENFALKNNCQIIIATHSPHIIGAANPEYLRVLNKIEDKIEVLEYSQSYGLEFNEILTSIMGVKYLRTPIVAQKMANVKSMIVQNEYDSDEFKKEWSQLEEILGKKYLDLKLLKLEITSRRKNV
ncbi:MAG: ATP-binding protein [Sulfurovum sp.]|nr:ATP-binding protein [Sulfurovum sp.]